MVLAYPCDEGCTQAELCERLLVKGANMTSLVRRMERDGLIVRSAHPSDERAWWVTLSARGAELLTRVEPDYYRQVQRLMKVHSAQDLAWFSERLECMRVALSDVENLREPEGKG